MAETSGIEWTQATWNPFLGCTKVSPGCANCYMFTEQKRYGNDPELVRRSKTKFADPLKWKDPKLIFTCSWSDWFHADADQWREEAWDIIRRTPHHTYQILTKRPERIAEHLPSDWGDGYPNVWLGVSVEGLRYDYRAYILAELPARVRFISAEPLLRPFSIASLCADHPGAIDWLIAGGESGPKCRPMELAWARILRDDCALYGVAFFLKQLGGFPDKRGGEQAVLDGRRHTEMPRGRASVNCELQSVKEAT